MTMLPEDPACPKCGNKSYAEMEWVVREHRGPIFGDLIMKQFIGMRCSVCGTIEVPTTVRERTG